MGLFIRVEVDQSLCMAHQGCRLCLSVCPVDILAYLDGSVSALEELEDECLLCDLCVTTCPVKAITVNKLYVTTEEG